MRAADPKKIIKLSDAVTAIKRKTKNVSLNLLNGLFEVKDAKGAVVKTIAVTKGSDAAYIINNSVNPEDMADATALLNELHADAIAKATPLETLFAEKEDELLKAVAVWQESDPGAARRDLSIQIGRLQQQLADLDYHLRDIQYKHRGSVEVGAIKRRAFIPASFDDRVVPYPVYRLHQTQTNATMRTIKLSRVQ
jgi:hypothetical protein